MISSFLIYSLVDPRTKEIRYVGKSQTGLKRPRQHKKPSELKYETHKTHWIRQLQSLGLDYEINILEEFPNNIGLDEAEQRWINQLKSLGAHLTNGTDGGIGSPGRIVSEATKDLMSEKAKLRPPRDLPEGMKKRIPHKFINNIECKHCWDCELDQPLIDFHKDKNSWDGHRELCKKCALRRKKEYDLKQPKLSPEEWSKRRSEISKETNIKHPKLLNNLKPIEKKPIQGISELTGEVINFNSGTEAAKFINGSLSRLSICVKEKKPFKGFVWSYVTLSS